MLGFGALSSVLDFVGFASPASLPPLPTASHFSFEEPSLSLLCPCGLGACEPRLANENLCDWFRFGCLTTASQCGFALGLLLEKEPLSELWVC